MNWRKVGAVAGGILLVAILLAAVFGLPTHLLFQPTESGASAGLAADDIEAGLDVRWTAVECGLNLVDEMVDSRTTHRR